MILLTVEELVIIFDGDNLIDFVIFKNKIKKVKEEKERCGQRGFFQTDKPIA